MMKPKVITLTLTLVCLVISPAQAQVTIDVSKITCEQHLGFKITDPNNIALWLSGYYNGQRGNTIIEPQSFKENIEKLKNYCFTNPKVPVMQAVEIVFGKGK